MTEAADLREALLDQLAYLIDEIEALKGVVDRVPQSLQEARPLPQDLSMKETYGLLATPRILASPEPRLTLALMSVESHAVEVETQGHSQVLDITDQVVQCVDAGAVSCGIATVFVIGSTAAITTTEFEPGLATRDLAAALEKVAPVSGPYLHEETWHDDNGHSHVRAVFIGPSLTVPVVDGRLQLGTWQQIVLMDFDTRPRSRRILIQVIGE